MDSPTLVKIARALGDPTRLRIFEAIARDTGLCCGDVGRRLPVTQATVSHHLRVLTDAGLVESRREGQLVRVRAVPETLQAYHQALGDLVSALGAACERATGDSASEGPGAVPGVDASPAARRARRLAQLDARYPPADEGERA